MKYPKIGLALGSGGARGIAHIGVIKTLEKYKIPIDIVAGSSIGAVVAASYAQDLNGNRLQEIALSFSERKMISFVDFTLKGGLMKGNKLEAEISELLGEVSFSTSKIPFAVVATDYHTAEEVVFYDGDLVKAIRASIAVPPFLQPVADGERVLADGGLSNPVPVEVVKKMGADIVIAVNLDTVYLENEMVREIPSLSSVPMHAIYILRHQLALKSSKNAGVVIAPQVAYVGYLGWDYFFSKEKIMNLIQEGERVTEELIPQIKALISQKKRERSWFRRLLPF
ncbi:patatin family protein [Candidatus Roizmanbacteria bacterium]|nr:patatin family protein [Candidatus Roizmanbacteria bacterium]